MSLTCKLIVVLASLHGGVQYDIPPRYIIAISETETDFRCNVESDSGDVGPAQVNPRWWSDIGYNLNNPYENVLAAAYILDKYRNRCNNITCAIRAYNKGITRIQNNPKAGQNYLNEVKRNE